MFEPSILIRKRNGNFKSNAEKIARFHAISMVNGIIDQLKNDVEKLLARKLTSFSASQVVIHFFT